MVPPEGAAPTSHAGPRHGPVRTQPLEDARAGTEGMTRSALAAHATVSPRSLRTDRPPPSDPADHPHLGGNGGDGTGRRAMASPVAELPDTGEVPSPAAAFYDRGRAVRRVLVRRGHHRRRRVRPRRGDRPRFH